VAIKEETGKAMYNPAISQKRLPQNLIANT